jgi:hypothetical protein
MLSKLFMVQLRDLFSSLFSTCWPFCISSKSNIMTHFKCNKILKKIDRHSLMNPNIIHYHICWTLKLCQPSSRTGTFWGLWHCTCLGHPVQELGHPVPEMGKKLPNPKSKPSLNCLVLYWGWKHPSSRTGCPAPELGLCQFGVQHIHPKYQWRCLCQANISHHIIITFQNNKGSLPCGCAKNYLHTQITSLKSACNNIPCILPSI